MNPSPPVDASFDTPANSVLSPTRPLYWSVRRELWENRSIYLAPLGVAVFAVVALVIHAGTMPGHMPGMLANDPAAQGSASYTYRIAALLLLVTAFVVGAVYSLEALNSERRDRSILFWKSLPVSDLTTVLAKASVPLVILPLIAFATIVAMHVAMLLLSAIVLVVQGYSVAPLWREVQLLRMWPALAYGVLAMALWHAPLHAFLLLMSGWARRTAALWAVLPLVALGVIEKVTLDSTHVANAVRHRLVGWYGEAFVVHGRESIPFAATTAVSPGRLLSSPDLWLGLLVAAALLVAAVRVRRTREPG
jgi:ABC-2 type transport system permease protein